MTILGGAGTTLNPQTINELVISSQSAEILAKALKPLLEGSLLERWTLVLAAAASAVAAGLSFWVVRRQSKIQRDSFVNSIHKLFFEIQTSLPLGAKGKLTKHHKQLVCNYFDFVCWLLEKKRLNESDIEPLLDVMKEKQFESFAKRQIKSVGGELYKSYDNWLKSN